MKLTQIKNLTIESLLPSYCYGCRRQGTYLCQDCFEITNSLPHPICPHCKTALGMGKLHNNCKKELKLNRLFSCADYSDLRINSLIKDLKYKHAFALAEPLAEFAYWWLAKNEYLNEIKNNVDLIIPVPLHKSKLKKRGFNHASHVAKHLGVLLDIPLEDGLLIKTQKTKPQTETENKNERQKNLKNAFSVISDIPSGSTTGKKVLLVDDVVTTGSTLAECAQTLRYPYKDSLKRGTREVWALTIAQD